MAFAVAGGLHARAARNRAIFAPNKDRRAAATCGTRDSHYDRVRITLRDPKNSRTIPIARKSKNISNRILNYLGRDDYQPERVRELAKSMGVNRGDFPNFREEVKNLMREGRVVRGNTNCLMLPEAQDTIIGTFRANPRGFGFVIPSAPADRSDLFIPPGQTMEAMTGDTVVARITRRSRRDGENRDEGVIIEIRERGQSRFVGELVRVGRQWWLKPDGRTLQSPVLLGDVSATRARVGDQVVVELSEFPSGDRPPKGVVVEVLGRHGDPGIDTLSIIREFHFPEGFPEKVIEDARRAIREYDFEAEQARRDDLSELNIITIDPDEAKDYDDAISLTRKGKTFELGVHIADVCTLVRPGSALDKEAALRGNSIYLPRHVIPMLPEVLSNGLCSLQEGEYRLTKSVFIEYDSKGRRKAKRYANTMIRSAKRLTYGQATDIIEGKTKGFEPPVVELVKDMETLAQLIRKRRLQQGMVVLDLPGVELVFGEEDQVVDVEPEDTSFSHTLIEMFMVEANEAVAELMTDLDVPHLRRIHPEPPTDAQAKLGRFLRVLGKPLPEKMQRQDLNNLLDSVRGTDDAFAVNLAVLRSMAQAEYSPKRIGHFALASEHYSHFTSPIRRYPDLVLHRLLEAYLTGKLKRKADRASVPGDEELGEIARHCSFTERRAEDAERELHMIKILRLLEARLGEVEDGIVTGVTNMGIFVQLRKYQVDGLIRFDDLPDDWYDVDAKAGCVVGQMSGKRIAIGDRLKAQIAAVDVPGRELDLVLVELTGRSVGKGKKDKNQKGPSKARSKPVPKTTTRRPVRKKVKRTSRGGGRRGRR